LFSAITIASVITSLNDLKSDYQKQMALILYQELTLNGRDPDLANIPDPNIPEKPGGQMVVVNCLWCASFIITVSVGTFCMALKWWLRELDADTNPNHNTCWKLGLPLPVIRALIAFLPTFLHRAMDLYFAGGIMYLRQINATLGTVCLILGMTINVVFYLLIVVPSIKLCPPDHYSMFNPKQPLTAAEKAIRYILCTPVYLCCTILLVAIQTVLFPGIQSVPPKDWCSKHKKKA
jgi:hypothetical protein